MVEFSRMDRLPNAHLLEANMVQVRLHELGYDLPKTSSVFCEHRMNLTILHQDPDVYVYEDSSQTELLPAINLMYDFLSSIIPEDDTYPLFFSPILSEELVSAELVSAATDKNIKKRIDFRRNLGDKDFQPRNRFIAMRSINNPKAFILQEAHTEALEGFMVNGKSHPLEYNLLARYTLVENGIAKFDVERANLHIHNVVVYPGDSKSIALRQEIPEDEVAWRSLIHEDPPVNDIVGPKELAILLRHFEENTKLKRFL
ncbi:MAG: hypothetical protein Q8P72_02860 [Candidatus Roizmanbacteria bacterium]|nr:hypothetical protein [Candidatus Roizmanbacteria bacterium]